MYEYEETAWLILVRRHQQSQGIRHAWPHPQLLPSTPLPCRCQICHTEAVDPRIHTCGAAVCAFCASDSRHAGSATGPLACPACSEAVDAWSTAPVAPTFVHLTGRSEDMHCPQCWDAVPAVRLAVHLKDCDYQPCPDRCGEMVAARRLSQHLSACPLSLVLCGGEGAGCQLRIARTDLPQHHLLCPYVRHAAKLAELQESSPQAALEAAYAQANGGALSHSNMGRQGTSLDHPTAGPHRGTTLSPGRSPTHSPASTPRPWSPAGRTPMRRAGSTSSPKSAPHNASSLSGARPVVGESLARSACRRHRLAEVLHELPLAVDAMAEKAVRQGCWLQGLSAVSGGRKVLKPSAAAALYHGVCCEALGDHSGALMWYAWAMEEASVTECREVASKASLLLLRAGVHVRQRWACHHSLRAALDPRKAEAMFFSTPAGQRLDAWQWLEEEALRGRAWAQYAVGSLLKLGVEGVIERDAKAATSWLAAAAGQGLAEAQYALAATLLENYSSLAGGSGQLLLMSSKNLHEAAAKGHTQAQHRLGLCYLRGEGVMKDPHTACGWLSEAANLGSACREAQCELAECFAIGRGVRQSWEQAIHWYQEAAKAGHGQAAVKVGLCFQDGTGVAKNVTMSAHWFERAARAGDREGQRLFAEHYANYNGGGTASSGDFGKDAETALVWYMRAAKQGDPQAQYHIAESLAHGLSGAKQDPEKAAKFYEMAAAQGHVQAQHKLGLLHAQGTGVKLDTAKATHWLHLAASEGHKDALFELAKAHAAGTGVDVNPDQAEALCEAAAANGSSDAQFMLGCSFQRQAETITGSSGGNNSAAKLVGTAAWKAASKAAKWFRAAADQGHECAAIRLARALELGLGVKQDVAGALSFAEAAAQKGGAEAQYAAGRLHVMLNSDWAMAFARYSAASVQGHAEAQFWTGFCLSRGRGTTQHMAKAIAMFKRAAGKGHVEALFSLAESYQYGDGVPRNLKMAADLYAQAAAKGHRHATSALRDLPAEVTASESVFELLRHHQGAVDEKRSREAPSSAEPASEASPLHWPRATQPTPSPQPQWFSTDPSPATTVRYTTVTGDGTDSGGQARMAASSQHRTYDNSFDFSDISSVATIASRLEAADLAAAIY